MSEAQQLKDKIIQFKSSYHRNRLVIGTLLFISGFIALFLLLNVTEYTLWLPSIVRTFLFYGFLLMNVLTLIFLIIKPLLELIRLWEGISDQEAIRVISHYFPELKDQLLNSVQLIQIVYNQKNNKMAAEAFARKAQRLRPFDFSLAVSYDKAKKYGLIAGVLMVVLTSVAFISPEIITHSSKRYLNYTKTYVRDMPFSITMLNELKAFKGDDYLLSFQIEGNKIPQDVFVEFEKNIKRKLEKDQDNQYSYLFTNVQKSKEFHIEVASYKINYELQIAERPELQSLNLTIEPPQYTGEASEFIQNAGNIHITEGSKVKWSTTTNSSDEVLMVHNIDTSDFLRTGGSQFQLQKVVTEDFDYTILLRNQYAWNKNAISYTVKVIKDEFPTIISEYIPDTAYYKVITLFGNFSDDYGISKAELHYTKGDYENSFPLEIKPNSKDQRFYISWNTDSLQLAQSEELNFYIQVSDNDAINGSKSVKKCYLYIAAPK